MNTRGRLGVLVAVIGLLVIVVGSISVYWNYQSEQLAQSQTVSVEIVTEEVVVATRDLALGDLVTAADVRVENLPVEFAPRDVLSQTELAVGRILKTDVVQGEMILLHNLADPTNVQGDIAFVLRDDHVLLAVPASDLMSRHSIVQRGDLVDILVSITQSVEVEDPETLETETISTLFTFAAFQGQPITALVVRVVQEEGSATYTTTAPSPDQPEAETPVVNEQKTTEAYLLALDPQDALVLKNLIDLGANIDLVLRAPTSTELFRLDPVSSEYIIERYRLEILP